MLSATGKPCWAAIETGEYRSSPLDISPQATQKYVRHPALPPISPLYRRKNGELPLTVTRRLLAYVAERGEVILIM